MPSSTLFNPALPKTPAYPRRPRANESLLSTNGSPLTNPYKATDAGDDSPARPGASLSGGSHGKLERQRSIAVLHGPPSSQPTSSQGLQAPALEVVLSIKVPTEDGNVLEFDPLITSVGDLDSLKGVSNDAKRRAQDELQELSALMARLGKWRI